MSYSTGFPINTGPAPDGDSVKDAVEKHISEFLKAYADITAMYQQILVEIQHADVDTVDGKHADGTANNIPILNSSAELGNDVNNSAVTTKTLAVSGKAKVAELEVGGVSVGSLVTANVAVDVGIVTHGQTIPLPTGFTQAQCKWAVIPRTLHSVTVQEIDSFACTADENRVVSLTVEGRANASHTATYIIIGIKS